MNTKLINSLEQNGYMVVPTDVLDNPNVVQNMIETMADFPEFKPSVKSHVLGGFAALGNPASFHNPFVRNLRMQIMQTMIPVFGDFVSQLPNPGDWKLEQIVDRMMLRSKGLSASSESWHRDETPNASESDKTYGGWLNLDSHSQNFSLVPGTHKEVRGHSGFSTIKSKEKKKRLREKAVKVEIPPGHLLVFYEHTLHEVIATKAKVDQHRLFMGWRITLETEPLQPMLEQRLIDQSVMALKSNQIPPMYAKLHWTNWRQKIVDFSEHLKPQCTELRTVKAGKDAGKTYQIVHNFMHSLKDYGFPLYPEYIQEEIELLKPNTRWTIGGVVWEL